MYKRLWGMTSGIIVIILLFVCMFSYKACSGCHKIKSMTYSEFEERIDYGMTKEEVKAEFGRPTSLASPKIYFYKDIIVYEETNKKSNVLIYFNNNRVINYDIH